MAEVTNGNFDTKKYTTSSNKTLGLNLAWSIKSQNIAKNTTTISWTLKSVGTLGSGYTVDSGPVVATINGTKVVNTQSRFAMKGSGGYKKTGTLTITHTANGTKTVSMSVKANIYTGQYNDPNCTGSASYTLKRINRYALIGEYGNFTDEENPTITFTNPAGGDLTSNIKARLKWENGGTEVTTDWSDQLSDDGGTYTFNLDSYRSALRSACANSNTLSVTYDLISTMNETDYHDTKTATMNIVNANPAITSGILSYLDTDSATVTKTNNNNQIIVQGQGNLRINIDTTKVSPVKSATISEYGLLFNGEDCTLTTSGNTKYADIPQPNIAGIVPAKLVVMDSRGNTSESTLNITVHELSAPTATFSLVRENNFETNTTLTVNSLISSVASTNAVTITEQHKEVGSVVWSAESSVTDGVGKTLSLTNTSDWNVRIIVADKYYSQDPDSPSSTYPKTVYTTVVSKGTPLMFFDKKRHSVGVNCYPDADNQLRVDGTIKSTGKLTAEGTVFPRYAHLITAEAGTSGTTINTTSWKNIGSSNTIDIEAGKYIFELQLSVGYSTSTGRFRAGIKLDDVAYEGVNNVSQPSSAGCINFYGEIEITTSGNHTFQIVGRVDNTGKTVTTASYTVNTILLLPTK